MAQRLRIALAGVLLALAVAGSWWAFQQSSRPVDRQPLGLMTSLPLYWPEGADMVAVIGGEGEQPWVRSALESRYEITPLDTLSAAAAEPNAAPGPLDGLQRLLIAQPRGLSPEDNVALDDWVRSGGRLLLVIDPMLTGQYSVPLGDPRHPLSVGLIPPVVGRWGMHLQYDERQPLQPRLESYGEGQLPVLLAGQAILTQADPTLTSAEDLAARGDCRILGGGIAAQCAIGRGRVTLVADATLLESPGPDGDAEDQLLELAEFALE